MECSYRVPVVKKAQVRAWLGNNKRRRLNNRIKAGATYFHICKATMTFLLDCHFPLRFIHHFRSGSNLCNSDVLEGSRIALQTTWNVKSKSWKLILMCEKKKEKCKPGLYLWSRRTKTKQSIGICWRIPWIGEWYIYQNVICFEAAVVYYI